MGTLTPTGSAGRGGYVFDTPKTSSQTATPTPVSGSGTGTVSPTYAAGSPTPTESPFAWLTGVPGEGPTVTPAPDDSKPVPVLTVNAFADSSGVAKSSFTLSGSTDPSSTVDISITPDNIIKRVTAGTGGKWSFKLPKQLSTGTKQLQVLATNPKGGQKSVTQTFTVKSSGGGFPTVLIWLVLIGGGVFAYLYYKKRKTESQFLESNPSEPSPFQPDMQASNQPPQPPAENPGEPKNQ